MDKVRPCTNCPHAVRSEGRGWVHADTGGYRCPGSWIGGGWAAPVPSEVELTEMLGDAEDRGYAHAIRDVIRAARDLESDRLS